MRFESCRKQQPKTWIPNPTRPGGRQAVEMVTDRALRYRAQRNIEQPDKICIYCGMNRGRLDVEHINGFEEDGDAANLAYACRPCNTAKGAFFARLGMGRKTRQYNPSGKKPRGARNWQQYAAAVLSVTPRDPRKRRDGPGPMDVSEAVEMIRATSPAKRSEFAQEIAGRRAARKRDDLSAVPF